MITYFFLLFAAPVAAGGFFALGFPAGLALTDFALAGAALAGLALTGFALAGAGLTGFALAGFALAGAALTGFALTGFALAGAALAGFGMTLPPSCDGAPIPPCSSQVQQLLRDIRKSAKFPSLSTMSRGCQNRLVDIPWPPFQAVSNSGARLRRAAS
jgi:hypothetical protein